MSSQLTWNWKQLQTTLPTELLINLIRNVFSNFTSLLSLVKSLADTSWLEWSERDATKLTFNSSTKKTESKDVLKFYIDTVNKMSYQFFVSLSMFHVNSFWNSIFNGIPLNLIFSSCEAYYLKK